MSNDNPSGRNVKNLTPKEIAETIFIDGMKDPCSFQFLPHGGDSTHTFQILLHILMEGFDKLVGLEDLDMECIKCEEIIKLRPGFLSMGFDLKVHEYDESDESDKELWNDYYCKIFINTGNYKLWFTINKHIKTQFHFITNGKYRDEDLLKENLNEIYSIIKANNKIISITFDYISPLDKIGNNFMTSCSHSN